jgi:hypothetical protein
MAIHADDGAQSDHALDSGLLNRLNALERTIERSGSRCRLARFHTFCPMKFPAKESERNRSPQNPLIDAMAITHSKQAPRQHPIRLVELCHGGTKRSPVAGSRVCRPGEYLRG